MRFSRAILHDYAYDFTVSILIFWLEHLRAQWTSQVAQLCVLVVDKATPSR